MKTIELTKQEYKVALLIEIGHKNKKISLLMGISEKTVSTYIIRIYKRIKLPSENNVYVLVNELNRMRLLDEREVQH